MNRKGFLSIVILIGASIAAAILLGAGFYFGSHQNDFQLSATTSTVSFVSPLSISFISPKNGDTVSGTVEISVAASSTYGITNMTLYKDNGNQLTMATSSPLSFIWHTEYETNGHHILTIVAFAADASSSIEIKRSAKINISITGGTINVASASPVGAESDYSDAAKHAIANCGQDVQLAQVESRVFASGLLTDYFFRGDCGDGTEQLLFRPGYTEPTKNKVESDNRLPIDLSKWKISTRQALQLSGLIVAGGNAVEPTEDLFQQSSSLVWIITQNTGYVNSEIHIDATTGEIISKKVDYRPIDGNFQ